MNILKWFNTWLTPEEEEELKNPTRRVFTFGLVSAAVSLVVPSRVFPSAEELYRIGWDFEGGGPGLGLERSIRLPFKLGPFVDLSEMEIERFRAALRGPLYEYDEQLQPAANKGQRAKARGRA